MKPLFAAAGAILLAATLPGCGIVGAAVVADAATGIGIASGVASIAKDVLEVDISWHGLLGAQPPKASPAAVQ